MAKIFLSYRRQDNPYVTDSIYRELRNHFGRESVFKDVESIPIGVDYHEYIQECLSDSSVLLTVIGSNWLKLKDKHGNRKIDNPNDIVRFEIEYALKQKIPIIPLFHDGTEVPQACELPSEIQALVSRNGIFIRPSPDFDKDIKKLINALENLISRQARIETNITSMSDIGIEPDQSNFLENLLKDNPIQNYLNVGNNRDSHQILEYPNSLLLVNPYLQELVSKMQIDGPHAPQLVLDSDYISDTEEDSEPHDLEKSLQGEELLTTGQSGVGHSIFDVFHQDAQPDDSVDERNGVGYSFWNIFKK